MKLLSSSPEDSPYALVNYGIDTLVLNVRYPLTFTQAENGLLPEPLIACLNAWQAVAREQDEPAACPLHFRTIPLQMYPHGAGRGQWRWLLKCPFFNLTVSRGKLSGVVAQVRFSSQFLWSSEEETYRQDVWPLLVEVSDFLNLFFTGDTDVMGLQVSELHLCADITGWDVSACNWQDSFLSRARTRRDQADVSDVAGGAAVAIVTGRKLSTLNFGSHGAPLSACIYNKSQEIKKSDKLWFQDIWKRHGYDDSSEVWRVEMRWKREALHEAQTEDFHGIELLEELGLPDRLPWLWTYAVGHVQGGVDGLPDGWLRYCQPSEDETLSRWSVHPAWAVIQSAFCSRTERAVNVTTGEVFELPLSPIGDIIRKRHYEVNVKRLAQQMGGCASTLAAWLGGSYEEITQVFSWLVDHLPAYALPDLARALPADRLSQEYATLFLEQIDEKQALYDRPEREVQ